MSLNFSDLTWNETGELAAGQRFSSYPDAQKLCKGPQPVPSWVVTERAAVDTYLGVLKSGKEADCLLMERAVPGGRQSILAAKRYRGEENRQFHRDADYTDGRRTRNSRDNRAVVSKSRYGRQVAAGQWAWAEWEALKRYWTAGLPVPYPVQLEGTEILMEYIEVDGDAAPRLAQTRPSPGLLAAYFDQVRDVILGFAAQGVAHGDLSAYNILAAGDRLVVIDLPQVVDVIANPRGFEFLLRDCHNMCAWFARRGLDVDADALFAEALGCAY